MAVCFSRSSTHNVTKHQLTCTAHPLDQTKYRMQVLKSNSSMLNVLYRFAARDGKFLFILIQTMLTDKAFHRCGLVCQHPSFVKDHTRPLDSVSIHTSQTNLEDTQARNYQLHKISLAQVSQAVLQDWLAIQLKLSLSVCVQMAPRHLDNNLDITMH